MPLVRGKALKSDSELGILGGSGYPSYSTQAREEAFKYELQTMAKLVRATQKMDALGFFPSIPETGALSLSGKMMVLQDL